MTLWAEPLCTMMDNWYWCRNTIERLLYWLRQKYGGPTRPRLGPAQWEPTSSLSLNLPASCIILLGFFCSWNRKKSMEYRPGPDYYKARGHFDVKLDPAMAHLDASAQTQTSHYCTALWDDQAWNIPQSDPKALQKIRVARDPPIHGDWGYWITLAQGSRKRSSPLWHVSANAHNKVLGVSGKSPTDRLSIRWRLPCWPR